MKKLVSIILSLCMLLSITAGFGMTVSATETSGQCGNNAFWTYDESNYTLTISGTGATYNPNYEFLSMNIKNIVIEDGITTIGRLTFYHCEYLTSITIPDSVTAIGDGAFDGCISLVSVTIPDGVSTIENRTFCECGSLISVKIPDSVTSIGSEAFAYCRSLTSITIPDGVTSIGRKAFHCCTSLTSIAIPDNVTTIGSEALSYCDSITSITIPASVKSIDATAFEGCNSITEVNFVGSEEEWNNSPLSSMADLNVENIQYDCVSASADMVAKGGSIRPADNGLRFGFAYKEQGAQVQEYGFIYTYSKLDYFDINTAGVKTRVATNRIAHDDGTTSFNLVFTGVPKTAYDTVISARAYVVVDGEYYYSDILQRSFRGVAQAAINDAAVDEELKATLIDLIK